MLHINFQGNLSFGSTEEEFFMFLPYLGMADILVIWTGPFEQIFVPQFPWKIHMKFCFNQPSCFSGKALSKCWIQVTLVQGQWMTLTFDIHTGSCTQLTASTNSFWNIHCLTFFPYKSINGQIWPCREIGKGQPRVIIWINLVVLEHPVLHTKFLGHWPFGSGEEDF